MNFNRLEPGSLVLVTGATGLVGSSIVELLLKKGFRVRAIGRSATKAAPFITHLQTTYGADNIEFVELANQVSPGAFDSSVQGVVGIIHVAADMTPAGNADTEAVLKSAATSAVGIMTSAAKTPSVKSFVLTASSIGVFNAEYGKDIAPSLETFNEGLIPLAKSIPPEAGAIKALVTYGAAKVASELGAWKFWRETKPSFAFNTILPTFVAGPVANPAPGHYSTHTWLTEIFLNTPDSLGLTFINPADWLVDTRDVAAIHVAVLLSDSTNGERLWAAGHPFSGNQVLGVWREAFPGREIREDFEFPEGPKIVLDKSKSTKMLKELEGREWYSLEETVIANVQHVL